MCGNDFLQASHLCSFPLCFHLVAHLRAIGMVPYKIKLGANRCPFVFGTQVFFSVLITTSLSVSGLNVSHGWASNLGQKAVLPVYICCCAVCAFIFLELLQHRCLGEGFSDLVRASLSILNYTCLDMHKWIKGMP